jgi:hypothetical protein
MLIVNPYFSGNQGGKGGGRGLLSGMEHALLLRIR